MAAFDRIQSGIPEMDAAFDNIRLGDISDHFTDRIRPVLTIIPDKHKMTYRSARECLIPRAFLMLNWMGNRYEKRSG